MATERGQALDSADYVAPSWTHSWNTDRLPAPPKPHGDTLVFTPCLSGLKLAGSGITAENTADIFTTAVLDVCMAFSTASRRRSPLIANSRTTQNEIVELRQQGIHRRPFYLASVLSRHRLQPERAADVGAA